MHVSIPGDAAISGRLRAALERMIEPDVGKRLQSADEVVNAMPVAERHAAVRRRTGAWAGLAASLLVMVASLALVLSKTPDAAVPGPEPPANERRAASTAPGRADGVSPSLVETESKAWESFEPVPPDPDRSKLVAQGLLTFAGQPLEATFAVTPKLRVWSEAKRGELETPMRYSGSVVELFDLEPGVYSVWASHWDGRRSFHGGSEVRIEQGRVVQFEFHLAQRLQLRGLEGAERRQGACEIVVATPLVLEWDPLEKETFYDYVIYESRCDGKQRARPVKSGSTTEARLAVELPPNDDGLRYQISISARSRGTWVGNGGAQFVVGPPGDAKAPKVE
jgi:hypothetical protein